jgi:RHH-type transcriptional regulator, proline utilization regulon repressor / proline dehydrogenase / delta 1-pyrroline-5-carboxylate dehydrogenase
MLNRLPSAYRSEATVIATRLEFLSATGLEDGALLWNKVVAASTPWVLGVRNNLPPFWAMESLLKEYPLSSSEGLALMRLAEALMRIPDTQTAIALTADQLSRADFAAAGSTSLARLSATALSLSKRFLPDQGHSSGLLGKLGAATVVAAAFRAVQLLGKQFVLGQSIKEAISVADQQRIDYLRFSKRPLVYSYDMLGEGARTQTDAAAYFASYLQALNSIASSIKNGSDHPRFKDGLSIKLSALHPRYEYSQKDRVLAELVPRVWLLCELAAKANINLTIDAEEVDRLELSLDVVEALISLIAAHHPHWQGFGLAIQAYQTRALELIEAVVALSKKYNLPLMCRLVKGAYWDAEIKRAQEMGLPHYPVFTEKHHTDISYLACAKAMLSQHALIYSQFATHNAATIAAILQMAKASGAGATQFELQRLHGMGEGIYRELIKCAPDVAVRVYAPVGEHKDLLAYLVRRLLENGANSSFVHQLADENVDVQSLLQSPLSLKSSATLPLPLPLPQAIFGTTRLNSRGLDLADATMNAQIVQALQNISVDGVPMMPVDDVPTAFYDANETFQSWRQSTVEARAIILENVAQALQDRLPEFCALLILEAHKTWGDAISEVREAIDFLRYYAGDAVRIMQPHVFDALTGESNVLKLKPRGVWVCISPWNFPLAIFVGQVSAALATGNCVLAKPAEQTPAVAQRIVELFHACGIPTKALQLCHGLGETVGAALVKLEKIQGVVFTGSTQVAKIIQRKLSDKAGPIIPFIAETGGINAMVVDSSALPEQVCDAVIQSSFKSAGQRCSALRLLCIHEAIADHVVSMILGAMRELIVGPSGHLSTDVPPVIDDEAFKKIVGQLALLGSQLMSSTKHPNMIEPQLIEIDSIDSVTDEIFGPVLLVYRYQGDSVHIIDQINQLGYGLTLGIQTRIDSRAVQLAAAADVGNVYVNRNMIGAVVGLQPFGGEGASGTGPKAGGPHYLYRFCKEQTITINNAAAGGNVALMVNS